MILPRLYFLGFKPQILAKILIHLVFVPFEIKILPFSKIKNVNEWLTKLNRKEFADFYFIDCWALFEPEYDKATSLEDFSHKQVLVDFVNEDIIPLKKRFEQIVYHSEFVTLIFDSIEDENFAYEMMGVYIGKVSTAGYDVFSPFDHDFKPHMQRIREKKILDIDKQVLRKMIDQLAREDFSESIRTVLVDPTLRVVDEASIIKTFKVKCQQFLFLCELYKISNGHIKKIKTEYSKKLNEMYDSDGLRKVHNICLTKKPQTSRYDFQIIDLLEKLYPKDSDKFVVFLEELTNSSKPKSENRGESSHIFD